MPLQITIKNDLACPVVICDFCAKEIETATDGNYEWQVDEHGKPATGQILFTHKKCCLPFEDANGGRNQWFTIDLDCLPLQLTNNLKIDTKNAEKKAEVMQSM